MEISPIEGSVDADRPQRTARKHACQAYFLAVSKRPGGARLKPDRSLRRIRHGCTKHRNAGVGIPVDRPAGSYSLVPRIVVAVVQFHRRPPKKLPQTARCPRVDTAAPRRRVDGEVRAL